MNSLIEIRWHGRGGQGAKTASLLLADAAFTLPINIPIINNIIINIVIALFNFPILYLSFHLPLI